jgi:hypothetical protein
VSVRAHRWSGFLVLRFTTYCDENCRSRSTSGWNVPAIANVRVEFSERKENLEREQDCGGDLPARFLHFAI